MKKPIVLVIMDGVGKGDGGPGDAVAQAKTPTLDKLMSTCPMTWLKAHGTAVGLPTGRPQRPRLRPDLLAGRQARAGIHRIRLSLRLEDMEDAHRQLP